MFRLSHNTSHNPEYAMATMIIPRSELIRRPCTKSNSVEEYPSGEFDVILEGGPGFPDMLGCGPYPFLIVSESVLETFKEEEILCFEKYPVLGVELDLEGSSRDKPQRYFRLEVSGKCEIDLKASGVELVDFELECHHLVTSPSMMPRFVIRDGSWDGQDLFRDPVLFPRVIFCTNRVLEIASRHQFTNFRFDPIQGPFNSALPGLDYLKRNSPR